MKDWRGANSRYALYLERFPTLSSRSEESNVPQAVLESEVFVMALNALAHTVVFTLLRPRAALLAGKSTWPLLPSNELTDVASVVRPDQEIPCRATLDRIVLCPGAAPATVLRCAFLRTVNGPNSDDELARVGRLLAQ